MYLLYITLQQIKKSDGYNYYNFCNRGLDYGEILNHIFINPNLGRNDGIDIWDNSYNHNRNRCSDVDYELAVPLQRRGKSVFQHKDTNIRG